MKYIHIITVHDINGVGGVGSVITDLVPQMAKGKKNVYIICLFKRREIDYEKENNWALENGIKILYAQDGNNKIKAITGTRKVLQGLVVDDECTIYMHLKWGVLAGVISSLGMKHIRRIEVYHSGYMHYKLQAFICRPFIHKYISVSNEAKEQLIHWFHIKREKIEVIYNGINIELIKGIAESVNTDKKQFTFLSAGRLSYEKGFLTSIQAYCELKKEGALKESRYCMLGDGPQLEKAKIVSNNEIDFWGRVAREEVYRQIKLGDIVILPSWWEGNSIILLEIMAIGKAVIVSDIPSFREVLLFEPLKDNELFREEPFGIVFRKKDIVACKQAMKYAFEHLDNLKYMDEYMARLASEYSIEKQAVKYIEC